jgi:ElaB/YqjD/DUF883 family membrane-anchored ribosome-binding protein
MSQHELSMQNNDWEREKAVNASTFDRIKSTVSEKIHKAADALHQKSERSSVNQEFGQDFSQYGHQAAEWLDRTADYVGEMNPEQIKTDLENQVRRNPGRTLLIAGGVGLLLGVLVRRR